MITTKRVKTLALLSLLSLCMQAQKLVIEKRTIDCGKSVYMMPVTAKFELKNKSLKRLTLLDVKPDCGCTKVSLPKKGLGPGEKCTIELTYDGRMLGHYVKQAALFTSASDQPVFLTMKGIVLSVLQDYSGTYPYEMGDLLTDMNVLEFDNVNRGDMPQQVIHIMNNGSETITPNVQHLPAYLTAAIEPGLLHPGQAGTITLTLNSQKIHGDGLTQTTIHLASQLGEKVQPGTEMPVTVVALPDLTTFDGKNKQFAPQMTLSADSLVLGLIDGKIRKSEVITIANKGRTPLEISSLQMFTPGLKLTLGKRSLQPGEQTKLKVTADRVRLLRQKTKPRLLMITNDPDQAKVIIKINIK
jgi:hypothetical protein